MEKVIYQIIREATEDQRKYLWTVLKSSSRSMSDRPNELCVAVPSVRTWGHAAKIQTIWRKSAINALEWYRFFGEW